MLESKSDVDLIGPPVGFIEEPIFKKYLDPVKKQNTNKPYLYKAVPKWIVVEIT